MGGKNQTGISSQKFEDAVKYQQSNRDSLILFLELLLGVSLMAEHWAKWPAIAIRMISHLVWPSRGQRSTVQKILPPSCPPAENTW